MTPEMEEVKPGKWACPVHEDIVVYATREPKCDLCQQTMPDQTPDAAREANGFGGYSRADVEDACRAADLVLAHPLTRNVGGPYIVLSTKDAAALVAAARAAVSRARDAAWRSAVEAEAALWLYHRDTDDHFGISWERKREEYVGKVAGLMAMVLVRMDTSGGANG